MEEIFNKLIEILKNLAFNKELDYSKITMDSRIVEDIGLNSIGMLYMVIAFEKEFQIQVHNISSDLFVTVRDVVKFIDEEING
ncbi:MAG: hypothetical protein PUA56_00515 [Bacillales bacterium]|nr:hypothetical protein [Bacillales bacterium]